MINFKLDRKMKTSVLISSQSSAWLYLLVFSRVSDAGEDGHADRQVQQQDADLPVTVLQTRGKESRSRTESGSGTEGGFRHERLRRSSLKPVYKPVNEVTVLLSRDRRVYKDGHRGLDPVMLLHFRDSLKTTFQ